LATDERVLDRRAAGLLADHPRVAPLVRLSGRVMSEQSSEQVSLVASGAAFWLIISVFPTAIAAVSLFGLVVSPQRVARDLAGLAVGGPDSLGSILTQQLRRVASADHVGLSAGLAVSVGFAVWSASRGVFNLDRAIRTAYGLAPDRYLRARARAFIGSFVVVLAVGVIALVSATGAELSAHVPGVVAVVVGVPIVVVVIACVLAGAYRFSVGHRVGVRRLLPGALGSSLALVVLAGGFAVYLRFSTRYTAVYGALAGTVIGMIGTYLAVYIVLIGAVFNAKMSAPAIQA
jgi:membrane protein